MFSFYTYCIGVLTRFLMLYRLLAFLFSEIEAIEACRWLRETGFPQYAQLYEGKLFLICWGDLVIMCNSVNWLVLTWIWEIVEA